MQAWLKSALQKIGAGLLYGIGIGISVSVISYYVSMRMSESMLTQRDIDKVVVSKHEEVRRDGRLYILGTVENGASEEMRAVSIQVDLFDKDGKFVDQCSEYLKGALKAGESRNFKVSCGGCKERPVVAHESYKVKVIGF